jgi:phenylacetate-CoA ligase
MNEIWNPEYETMSRDELHELQFKRLQMTALDVRERPLPSRPLVVQNLSRLMSGPRRPTETPFTVKSDFKRHTYGLFALPLEKIIRIHSTSGSISNPTVVGYSQGDLNTWSELCARVAVAGGRGP